MIDDNAAIDALSLSENNGKLYYTATSNGITEFYEYDPISKTVTSLGQIEEGPSVS